MKNQVVFNLISSFAVMMAIQACGPANQMHVLSGNKLSSFTDVVAKKDKASNDVISFALDKKAKDQSVGPTQTSTIEGVQSLASQIKYLNIDESKEKVALDLTLQIGTDDANQYYVEISEPVPTDDKNLDFYFNKVTAYKVLSPTSKSEQPVQIPGLTLSAQLLKKDKGLMIATISEKSSDTNSTLSVDAMIRTSSVKLQPSSGNITGDLSQKLVSVKPILSRVIQLYYAADGSSNTDKIQLLDSKANRISLIGTTSDSKIIILDAKPPKSAVVSTVNVKQSTDAKIDADLTKQLSDYSISLKTTDQLIVTQTFDLIFVGKDKDTLTMNVVLVAAQDTQVIAENSSSQVIMSDALNAVVPNSASNEAVTSVPVQGDLAIDPMPSAPASTPTAAADFSGVGAGVDPSAPAPGADAQAAAAPAPANDKIMGSNFDDGAKDAAVTEVSQKEADAAAFDTPTASTTYDSVKGSVINFLDALGL